MICRIAGVLAALFLFVNGAFAADVAGSKDPPGFKRFEGSEIIYYQTRSFDQYKLARDSAACCGQGWKKFDTVEGQITRVLYRVPQGHTGLELLRNYERMLDQAGYTKNFELAPCDSSAMGDTNGSSSAWWANANVQQPIYGKDPACYFTAKGSKNGKDVNIAVMIAESQGNQWQPPGYPAPVMIKLGEVLVGVDVIVSEPVGDKMIQPKAEDMSKALADSGKVELYGIYFDTDKTDIKPESKPTLDEVAKLLKGDTALKLEVGGHTDNTGTSDHNMTLSEGRAKSVVQALVKTYGVDGGRLQAKGYGDTKPMVSNDTEDGRAKNRRVELKKI